MNTLLQVSVFLLYWNCAVATLSLSIYCDLLTASILLLLDRACDFLSTWCHAQSTEIKYYVNLFFNWFAVLVKLIKITLEEKFVFAFGLFSIIHWLISTIFNLIEIAERSICRRLTEPLVEIIMGGLIFDKPLSLSPSVRLCFFLSFWLTHSAYIHVDILCAWIFS